MKDKFIFFHSVEKGLSLSRLITVINGYPFYCSTGSASGSPGTWFPFYCVERYSGVLDKYVTSFNKQDKEVFDSYLHKPTEKNIEVAMGLMERYLFSKKTSENSPADIEDNLINFPSNKFLNFKLSQDNMLVLRRLGSFETLYISKCLGGGFWEEKADELNDFFSYIEERAEHLLNKSFYHGFTSPVLMFLENMRSCNEKQIKEVSSIEHDSRHEYAVKINRFLSHLGASTLRKHDLTSLSFFHSAPQEIGEDSDEDSDEEDYWNKRPPQ